MKKNILLFIFLILLSKSYGQSVYHQFDDIGIDSVSIEYRSYCEGVFYVIKVTQDSISFYAEKDLDYISGNVNPQNQFYQIKRIKDIINYFYDLKVILNTEPIYEDSTLIVECMPFMFFTFYLKDCVVEKSYTYYSNAMFPYAYTMLHYNIFSIFNKNRDR
jgi:hypothetical protein